MTPLHHFGDFVRESVELIPLSWVRIVFVAIPFLILVWVLMLPKSETTPGEKIPEEDRPVRWDENLKIGASLALGFQILVYYLFG
jgi:hypothetical protein